MNCLWRMKKMEINIQELLRKIEDQEYKIRSAKVNGFMVDRET